MINTTDFLDALRSFEYVIKQKHISKDFKIQAKKALLIEIERLEEQIRDIDLGDEIEVIKGTNEALKNL